MCGGNFLDSKSMETNSPSGVPPTSSSSQQVALGSDTGAIYIMANLEVGLMNEWCCEIEIVHRG